MDYYYCNVTVKYRYWNSEDVAQYSPSTTTGCTVNKGKRLVGFS